MLRVYKYSVPVEDYFGLDLPQGSKILTVQVQYGEPQIWALVNAQTQVVETRQFRVAGTGHPIEESEDELTYIGTFQLSGGGFIGHLFEVTGK